MQKAFGELAALNCSEVTALHPSAKPGSQTAILVLSIWTWPVPLNRHFYLGRPELSFSSASFEAWCNENECSKLKTESC